MNTRQPRRLLLRLLLRLVLPRLRSRMTAGALGLGLVASHAALAQASAPEAASCSAESSLSSPGGDQCAVITPEELMQLLILLDEALVHAAADDEANGTTGAYATAAQYQHTLLLSARERVDGTIEWLESPALAPSETTTPNEAGPVGFRLLDVVRDLVYAGHWAGISAVHHKSVEAQSAFELGAQALELANELRARAYRCYINAYIGA